MKQFATYIVVLIALLAGTTSAIGQHHNHAQPVTFVPNQGQWEFPFLYKGLSTHADIFLEKNGVTYLVGDEANPHKMHEWKEATTKPDVTLKYHAYKVVWSGAQTTATTKGSKQQAGYHNYYLGNNANNWKTEVPLFGNIDYENVYPNIDVHFGSEKGHLKYDFIVKPGADVNDIVLEFEGLNKMSLHDGNLLLHTSVGIVQEAAPYAFQYIDGTLKEVSCKYSLQGNKVKFTLPKGYQKDVNLVIDPVIVFATLTGSTADNWGFTATYDANGNLYAGGIVGSPGQYPTTLGAFQITFNGGTAGTLLPCDVSISKFNATGNALIYSTYLGGNQDDMPHSLVVHNNELIVVGKTMSQNFPVLQASYDNTHNGQYDFFITKFNANGTALIGSTFLGGSGNDAVNTNTGFAANQTTLNYNYGDESRTEVITDKLGNIYVAGSTRSVNFPFTPNAAKTSLGGAQDGVLFKFNPTLSQLIYSTYLGGSNDDAAYVLALDTAQTHVYIAGGTKSTDFHSASTAGAYLTSNQGGVADGFICKFLNSGAYTLQRTTFIGTSAYDQCYGLQTDLEDGVYAMGQTMGAFPVSGGVYSNTGSRQFIIKLNKELTSNVMSTVYGTGPAASPNISPVAFLVDTCQNVYISGWGAYNGTSTLGLPVTGDAFQSTTDGGDFYFIVFSKNLQSLLFASFFGNPGKTEHVDGGTSRFDPQGVVYQAICASCAGGTGFPSTPGAYSTTNGSSNCNLGAVKIAFNLGSVSAQADAHPNARGCAPLTVNFGNTSSNAVSYIWNFGDNTPTSTATAPTHTFVNPGTYTVRMIAINPNACKTHDTAYLQIVVSTDTIRADFNFTLLDTCTNPRISISNTSIPRNGSSPSDVSYFWNFGDNTTSTAANPGTHPYAQPGTYQVMLIMTDTAACNSPDTIIKTVVIEQLLVDAGMNFPSPVCVGDTVRFNNTSVNGATYLWSFGDGEGNSTEQQPNYIFNTAGTYNIMLRTTNNATCNKVDSTQNTILVHPKPTAGFTFAPLTPETNKPTQFFNQSTQAMRYLWDFGDGRTSEEANPEHQYNRSGQYKVCLRAYNTFNCSDVVCKMVTADVNPLADVPTGFSPNGDGSNDILYVRGYSIQNLDFKIFNRWGEKVFETQNQSVGWDGTYKGVPQEMEVYAYTLFVTFFDGTSFKKQGNVTLLR